MNNNKKICIIGSGIAGCTMARSLAEKGFSVVLYEQNDFIGGNCHDHYDEHGILIHKFGPHIFHTNYEDVWAFANRFTKFSNYINQVLVCVGEDKKFVPFPINLDSIKLLFPKDVASFTNEIKQLQLADKSIAISELLTLMHSDSAKTILQYIYNEVYANYTAKMWGIKIQEIDPNVIKRVKINLNHVWNYFPDDKYCGLPVDGYTVWLTEMLNHPHISCIKSTSPAIEFDNHQVLVEGNLYDKVIYTGSLDTLFNYQFGMLPYRSLEFKFEFYDQQKFQDAPIVNYPAELKFTRICEYKYLTQQVVKGTTISYEYPGAYAKDASLWNIAFYPISNSDNITLYNKYKAVSDSYDNLLICGRLAEYKYYDMDDIIQHCMKLAQTI